jgi:hypothetical protein
MYGRQRVAVIVTRGFGCLHASWTRRRRVCARGIGPHGDDGVGIGEDAALRRRRPPVRRVRLDPRASERLDMVAFFRRPRRAHASRGRSTVETGGCAVLYQKPLWLGTKRPVSTMPEATRCGHRRGGIAMVTSRCAARTRRRHATPLNVANDHAGSSGCGAAKDGREQPHAAESLVPRRHGWMLARGSGGRGPSSGGRFSMDGERWHRRGGRADGGAPHPLRVGIADFLEGGDRRNATATVENGRALLGVRSKRRGGERV